MITFFTKIENGETPNPLIWQHNIAGLTGSYMVRITSASKRSDPQNRYLHGVLFPEFKNALIDAGYNIQTNEQAKSVIKQMFLQDNIVNEETGEMIPITKDTSELSKLETNLLIEQVIRFAAENMNYIIPYPNEIL